MEQYIRTSFTTNVLLIDLTDLTWKFPFLSTHSLYTFTNSRLTHTILRRYKREWSLFALSVGYARGEIAQKLIFICWICQVFTEKRSFAVSLNLTVLLILSSRSIKRSLSCKVLLLETYVLLSECEYFMAYL